jgi:hypothetical protein
MAYRSDVEAMEARLADLDAQVGVATRDRDDLAQLIAETRARERRQAILEDLQAGGPTKRLYRNASIALGAIVLTALGVLAVRAARPDRVVRRRDVLVQGPRVRRQGQRRDEDVGRGGREVGGRDHARQRDDEAHDGRRREAVALHVQAADR